MQATDVIHEEHSMIRCMLDCLAVVVDRAAESGTVDVAAPELLELFETFADGTHQLKEERVLFPRLMRQASTVEQERIQRLLEEHGRDKYMLRGIQSNLLAAIHGDPLSLREFVLQAAAYGTLHKRHMRKEHRTLMPLADRVLTEDDHREMLRAFERREFSGTEGPNRVRDRIETLCERYGIPGPSTYVGGS